MKVYLVVDTFQYDGGFSLFNGYLDPDQALIRQQAERRKQARIYVDYEKRHGKELASETVRMTRLEAIMIEEIEVI